MSKLTIREYESADIGSLTELWLQNFTNDTAQFVGDFFRMLRDMGTGLVAEVDGKLAGSAYVLCGQELILGQEDTLTEDNDSAPVCGYIYAVSVDKSFRSLGIGAALVKAAAQKAKDRGADIICTLPAEKSLYRWYEALIGVKCVLHRSREVVKSAPMEMYMPLTSTEYMLWRENMLSGRPHIHFSTPSLEFERKLCLDSGGGFYAAGCGIAAAYKSGDRGIIVELICTDECERRIVAASIGDALGVKEVVLYSPSETGEPYIAADSNIIPKDCVWNLSYD